MPQIFVKLPNGGILLMEVLASENIIHIKRKIEENSGISRDNQKIVFQGEILSDEDRIGEFGTSRQNPLLVVLGLNGIEIYVQPNDGEMLKLDVFATDRIVDIKKKIQDKIGVTLEEQTLIYRNKVLSVNSATVEMCGICMDAIISFAVQPIKLNVLVKNLVDLRTTWIETAREETIASIKLKVEKTLKLSKNDHELLLADKVLLDDSTVEECGIKNNVVIVVQRSKASVTVRTVDGKTCVCDVLRTDNVAEIKKKIAMKIGLSASDQVLIYNKTMLNDVDLLNLDTWHQTSAINVIPQPNDIKLFLVAMDGRRLNLSVKGTDTIGDLKRKVPEKWSVASDQRTLVSMGRVLSDEVTLAAYKISDGSTIYVVD